MFLQSSSKFRAISGQDVHCNNELCLLINNSARQRNLLLGRYSLDWILEKQKVVSEQLLLSHISFHATAGVQGARAVCSRISILAFAFPTYTFPMSVTKLTIGLWTRQAIAFTKLAHNLKIILLWLATQILSEAQWSNSSLARPSKCFKQTVRNAVQNVWVEERFSANAEEQFLRSNISIRAMTLSSFADSVSTADKGIWSPEKNLSLVLS